MENKVEPGTRWRDTRDGEVVEVRGPVVGAKDGWYEVDVLTSAVPRDTGTRLIVPGANWVTAPAESKRGNLSPDGFQQITVRGPARTTTTFEVSDPPDPESMARLLIALFPAGFGKSVLTEAQRRGIVLKALDMLREAGV